MAATAELATPPYGMQSRASKTLDIYVIDVEGGNATLLVAPSGESLLIDTGNSGNVAVRDAGRIMDAIKDAGLVQIDKLITTHWHQDHYGGMEKLAARIPIREFIDHGPNVQPAAATDQFLQTTYPQLYAKSKHTGRQSGRQDFDHWSRCARADLCGRNHQDAAGRCRQTQSILCHLQDCG
jgi:beta-lactamase superfamily II metal-dependent hydrolase